MRLNHVTQLAALLCLAPLTAAHAEPLGDLGDPARLHLEGNVALTAEQLSDAVRRDWLLQLAAAPSADRDAYVALVRRRLVIGYRSWGFPHADVAVALDEKGQTIVARISEGERWVAGDVVITGDAAIDRAALTRWLTEPQPADHFRVLVARDGVVSVQDTRIAVPSDESLDADQPPTWVRDKPVPFHDTEHASLHAAVRHGLLAQGLPNAEFELGLDQRDDRTVSLRIDVTSAGRPAHVEAIEVSGLERNAREDLLTYCGIEEGMRLDPDTVGGVYHALWRSGRFAGHTVVATPIDRTAGSMKLEVTLVEQADAPLLSATLSEAQAAALRLRDWLANRGPEDGLVATFVAAQATVRIALDGDAVACRADPPAQPPADGEPWLRRSYGVVAARGEVSVIDYAASRRCTAEVRTGQLVAAFGAVADPSKADAHGTFSVLGGIRTRSRGEARMPLAIHTYFDPVCFLALASDDANTTAVRDGVLHIDGAHHRLRADAATGRLLSWHSEAEDGQWSAELTTMPRAAATVAELEGIEQDGPVGGGALLGPVVQMLVEAVLAGQDPEQFPEVSPQQRLAAQAVTRLFADHVFAPLLELTGDPAAPEKLTIPVQNKDILRHGLASFILMALPATDSLWGRGSWPWTLGRQALLLHAGHSGTARSELGRLYAAGRMGPLANYAAARLAAPFNAPMAGMFARQGLERLSVEHLARDLAPLIDGSGVQPEVARRFIAALQTLTAEEAAAIDAVFLPDHRVRIAELHAALLDDAGQPIQTDAGALAKRWFPLLDAELRSRLDGIAAPPGPPNAPR